MNYTEEELIEALWLQRRLWQAAIIELAEFKKVGDEIHLLLTDKQKEQNWKIVHLLTRVQNPDIEK